MYSFLKRPEVKLARLIPAQIHPSVQSGAERRLFKAIQEEPGTDGWFVLHSYAFPAATASESSRGKRKLRSEADFIVICPRGVFVIEVKGGRVFRENNEWISTDRYGHAHRLKESPWDQAHNGAIAIRDQVRNTLRHEDSHPPSVVGYGVILADVAKSEDSPLKSEESNTTLFSRDVASPGFLNRFVPLLAKHRDDHFNPPGKKTRRLTPVEMKLVREALAGDYHYVESMAHSASEARRQIKELTQEQIQVLHEIEEAPRLLGRWLRGNW